MLAWHFPLPSWAGAALPSLLAVAAALLVIWLWLWRGGRAPLTRPLRGWTLPDWTRPIERFLHAVSQGLAALRDGHVGLQLLLLSALTWGLAVLNNLLLMRAFDFELPWISGVVVLLLLQIGITLPSAPASIGVHEYLTVVALSLFGVAESAALGYAILLHVLLLLPTLIGGALFWERSLSIVQLMRATSPPAPTERSP